MVSAVVDNDDVTGNHIVTYDDVDADSNDVVVADDDVTNNDAMSITLSHCLLQYSKSTCQKFKDKYSRTFFGL